ncbi:hypothetical protein ACHQM5_019420 [Ranunculus cassubicifolius]
MAFPMAVQLQWSQIQHTPMFHNPYSISLLFSLLLLLLCLNRVWARKSINLPPSPPKLPIIGHLHLLGALPHRSCQTLSKKYGPLILLKLGKIPTLVVQSAETAKEIMKTHDIFFANRPSITASKHFVYDGKDITFAPYGEYWREMRKVCVLELLSIKRVQSFRYVREEEISNMLNEIKDATLLQKEVNLSELLLTVTSNVISRVALSKRLGNSVYGELAKKGLKLFGHPSVEDMFPSLKWIDVLTGLDRRMRTTSTKLLQFFDDVIDEHLMARKNNSDHTDRRDFVDLLLEFEYNLGLTGAEFTRENLKGVLMDMFVAGTDTSYVTLEWAMAELVNHPNVMKKLQHEIRRVVGNTKYRVDENVINQMDYLNGVIKEVLRMHPPGVLSVPRESSASVVIEGYTIPTKTRVLVNLWAIGRDPKIWEKADEFIPERFINNPIDFRGQNFNYIPFGAGRRGCPGISFAVVSIESILANLLYWFDWELPGGEDKKGADMTEVFGLTVGMKYPLHLVPKCHNF